jgi:hypothetical protein
MHSFKEKLFTKQFFSKELIGESSSGRFFKSIIPSFDKSTALSMACFSSLTFPG